jgi:hypothetical protein
MKKSLAQMPDKEIKAAVEQKYSAAATPLLYAVIKAEKS